MHRFIADAQEKWIDQYYRDLEIYESKVAEIEAIELQVKDQLSDLSRQKIELKTKYLEQEVQDNRRIREIEAGYDEALDKDIVGFFDELKSWSDRASEDPKLIIQLLYLYWSLETFRTTIENMLVSSQALQSITKVYDSLTTLVNWRFQNPPVGIAREVFGVYNAIQNAISENDNIKRKIKITLDLTEKKAISSAKNKIETFIGKVPPMIVERHYRSINSLEELDDLISYLDSLQQEIDQEVESAVQLKLNYKDLLKVTEKAQMKATSLLERLIVLQNNYSSVGNEVQFFLNFMATSDKIAPNSPQILNYYAELDQEFRLRSKKPLLSYFKIIDSSTAQSEKFNALIKNNLSRKFIDAYTGIDNQIYKFQKSYHDAEKLLIYLEKNRELILSRLKRKKAWSDRTKLIKNGWRKVSAWSVKKKP